MVMMTISMTTWKPDSYPGASLPSWEFDEAQGDLGKLEKAKCSLSALRSLWSLPVGLHFRVNNLSSDWLRGRSKTTTTTTMMMMMMMMSMTTSKTCLTPRRFFFYAGIWRGARGHGKAEKSEVFPYCLAISEKPSRRPSRSRQKPQQHLGKRQVENDDDYDDDDDNDDDDWW